LFVDLAALGCFDKVYRIPTEQVDCKTVIARDDVEVTVPLDAGVNQYEGGSIVSRTRAKSGEEQQQCFP
jgi:hypothetical protein